MDPDIYLKRLRVNLHSGFHNEFRVMVSFDLEGHLKDVEMIESRKGDVRFERFFPKPVLRLDLRKLDDLRGKILRNFLFVKLTRNNFTQLSGDTRMRIVFAGP